MNYSEASSLLSAMQDTNRTLLLQLSEMRQRERRMQAGMQQQLQTLRDEAGQMHTRMEQVISSAGQKITQQTQPALTRLSTEFDRQLSTSTARLDGASRTIWMWFGSAASILLLVIAVGWVALGYYRKELATAKDQLARYENAVPIVQAFQASDAALCGDRLCVNVDPSAKKVGDKRQYRPARPRPQ